MNKERFLIDNYETYKPKFILCCLDCKTEKLVQKFAQLKDNQYICRIKIEEYGEK
jgi:hypothetical protein